MQEAEVVGGVLFYVSVRQQSTVHEIQLERDAFVCCFTEKVEPRSTFCFGRARSAPRCQLMLSTYVCPQEHV